MDLKKAQEVAYDLMRLHGLTDWRFKWTRAARLFGCCHYGKQIISLSAPLTKLNDLAEVTDVILHEVAHALADRGTGHGPVWRAEALRVGARPERCYNAASVALPPAPLVGVCPNCGRGIKAFRRRRTACGQCCRRFNGGKFDEGYLFIWAKAK